MQMALKKFNEYILHFQEAMSDAQVQISCMSSLWYAVCNQSKEKRERLINKLSKYGQELAHQTRNSTILSYSKKPRTHWNRRGLLTTTSISPALTRRSTEDLCRLKNKRTSETTGQKEAILISPQPLTGGKVNRIVQRNPVKERSLETTQGNQRKVADKEKGQRNPGAGPRNSRAIPGSERSQEATIGGVARDAERKRTTTANQISQAGLQSHTQIERGVVATQEKQRNQAAYLTPGNPGQRRTMPIPDKSQTAAPEVNPGKQRNQPATGTKDRSAAADSAMRTIPRTSQEMESRAVSNEDQRAKQLQNDERGANTARERTVRAIQEKKRTQAASVAGGNTGERRTMTILNENQRAVLEATPRSEAATRPNNRSAATYSARGKNPGTTQETETRATAPNPGTFPESQRSRVTSLTAGYPSAPGTRINPVVLLQKMSTTNIGMTSRKQKKATEEYVAENQSSTQECESYSQQEEQEEEDIVAVVSDAPSFVQELKELDAEVEEGHSAKVMTEPKQQRIGKIMKKKNQDKYKKVQAKGIQHPKSQKIKKGRKRKIISETSSEEEQWQPSEEQYTNNNNSEYSEKYPSKKKTSKKMTKQKTDNGQKQRYEQERLKLSTKKQTTDNFSTFLMDIPNQKAKKVTRKLEDYAPTKKQKKTEEPEIQIPKHLLTIITQKIKDKHVDKSHCKTQKQEWKGNPAERKRIGVIYRHIPEALKTLMRQNIELPEQERVEVEEKMVRGTDGTYKCHDCNEKSFQKKREIYRHIRIVHNYTPLMYVCGYDKCTEAANNTTTLGIHTLYAHFRNLFEKITIAIE